MMGVPLIVSHMFLQVRTFMLKGKALGVRQTIGDYRAPQMADIQLRVKLIMEEAIEFAESCGWTMCTDIDKDGVRKIFVKQTKAAPNFILAIDALCDLLYVVFGTFVSFGLNPTPFFNEVHRSNMSKFDGGVSVNADGKITKGKLYSPPNLDRVLAEEITQANMPPAPSTPEVLWGRETKEERERRLAYENGDG
jgi:predicted HAD superfamily Cof-like phosphohydrolase